MTSWVETLIAEGGYFGVFALMLLETVFPPIPSEVIMPLAGIVAAQGTLTLWGTIAAGTAGAMLGNIWWFALARWLGAARLERLVARHGRWLTLTLADVERVRRWFARRGGWAVGLGRVVPTIRSLISVPAGIIDMRWPRFLLWSTLGTAVWTAGLAGAGFALGQASFATVERFIGPLSNAVIVIAAAAYLYRVATFNRRRAAAPEAGPPPPGR